MRRRFCWLIAVFAFVLVGTACLQPASRAVAGQQLVYAIDFEPSGIDPHVNQAVNAHRIIANVFDPLVYRKADGAIVPGLAERWQISPDGLTYTFTLRSGVKFHDGTPFDADAVVFSFDRIRNPDTRSQLARPLLQPVQSYEATDPRTVVVRLAAPYPAFLDALSYAWLAPVSPTAVRLYGSDFGSHLVGTGPFKLAEWVRKDHIRLERNPDYAWAPSFFAHSGPAYLESVTFTFVQEWSTRSAIVESGEADITSDALATDLARLRADSRVNVVLTQMPGIPQSYALNSVKAPLDDVAVRRALLRAVDKETLIGTMHGGAFAPAYGPLSRASTAYDARYENDPAYGFDRDAARRAFDEAGWRMGADGVRVKDGQPLRLEWLSMAINRDPQQGELLQGILREVGIDLRVNTVANFGALTASIQAGDYHLVPTFWLASDPIVLTQNYHSRYLGANNWTKARVPELDRLLDQADAAADEAERVDLYQQAQRLIMERALVVPVWDVANVMVARSELSGLTFDRRGVYLWLYDVRKTR